MPPFFTLMIFISVWMVGGWDSVMYATEADEILIGLPVARIIPSSKRGS